MAHGEYWKPATEKFPGCLRTRIMSNISEHCTGAFKIFDRMNEGKERSCFTYYFHVGRFEEEQWLKDKPWHIDNLALVLCQLQAIERDKIKWKETINILELLINLIKNAIDNKEEISIYCD